MQKKEGANTHQHTWPGAGKPWKGKGKEKRRVDGHGTRPAEGGKTEAPEPTWHSENLRLPAREGLDLPWEGRTHEIGDQMGD